MNEQNQSQARELRQAIENLIDAKLLDLLGKPGGLSGGLDRLLAHRRTGVASFDIRAAEKRLDKAIDEILTPPGPSQGDIQTAMAS